MKCPNKNTEEFSSLKNEKEELYFYFKDSYGDVINKKNSLGFYIQGLKEIKPNQYEFNGNKNLLLQLLKLNKIKFNIENDIIKTPTSTIILLDKKEKIKSINLEDICADVMPWLNTTLTGAKGSDGRTYGTLMS